MCMVGCCVNHMLMDCFAVVMHIAELVLETQSLCPTCNIWFGKLTVISARTTLAATAFLAMSNKPETGLSRRCTGNSLPRSGLSTCSKAITVFLRYCPDTCTGTLGGLCTAIRSSVSATTCHNTCVSWCSYRHVISGMNCHSR